MKETVLYQLNRIGNMNEWKVWIEEVGADGFPELWVEFGVIDGAKQRTFSTISEGKNIGKINETTTIQQAILELERKVVEQKECGYYDSIEEANKNKNLDVDFSERLPKQLCFYKPKNSCDAAKISKLEKTNRAVFTVKRDGQMAVVRKTEKFGVEIYSRRMDLTTEKYPHLIQFFDKLPNNTILLGEMILNNNGVDNFNIVSKICRSDKEQAIEKQKEFGYVSYYIFDVAFLNGNCLLTSMGYLDRRNKLMDCFSKYVDNKNVMFAEIIKKSHKEAMEEIVSRKLEGLVVWDSAGIMDKTEAFVFNGKAYRPNVLWKSKPKFEDDFIAIFDPENGMGEYGTGKNEKLMKSVHLFQLDELGNKSFICKCGGGFTEEDRIKYSDKNIYPLVFQIEFDSIQTKTGSLRFPIFSRERKDKNIDECLLSNKIKEARCSDEED